MDIPFQQRQKCVENTFEQRGMNSKKVNREVFRKLKNSDEVEIYRGFTVSEKSDVRVGRKKVNNPKSPSASRLSNTKFEFQIHQTNQSIAINRGALIIHPTASKAPLMQHALVARPKRPSHN